MAAKIILQRKKEFLNRLRNVIVFINDEEKGVLKSGGVEEYSVEAGVHRIQCRLNWYTTREFNVVLNDGDKKFLRVRMGMKYFGITYIFVIAALLSDLGFRLAKIPPPENWAWVKLAIVIPVFLYYLFFITVGKKHYLVLEEDSENIFN